MEALKHGTGTRNRIMETEAETETETEHGIKSMIVNFKKNFHIA